MRCADKPCQCCARPMTLILLVFGNDEKGLGCYIKSASTLPVYVFGIFVFVCTTCTRVLPFHTISMSSTCTRARCAIIS